MTLDVAVEESTEVSIVKLISPVDQAIANIRAQEPEGRSRAERMALWIFDYLKDRQDKKAVKPEKISNAEDENSEDGDESGSTSESDLVSEVELVTAGIAAATAGTKSTASKDKSPTGWLTGAIPRAASVSVATHIAKGIHTSDKGTKGFISNNQYPNELGIVGTHSLDAKMDIDHAVSNATEMDVKTFSTLVFEESDHKGLSILELAEKSDCDFLEALDILDVASKVFVGAISKIGSPSVEEISLTYRGKQVYYFIGNDVLASEEFHLLSVYFQSSLVHAAWKALKPSQEPEVKAARIAKYKGLENPMVVTEYPNTAHMKVGGEKPQNAGSLNNLRSGNVMMLGCIPPKWSASKVRPAYKAKSIFDILNFDKRVKRVVDDLAKFLLTGPLPNLGTRRRRDAYTNELIDLVVDYAEIQRSQGSGWSADPRCHLLAHHKAVVDGGSESEFDNDRISQDFANWLSLLLGKSIYMVASSTAQFKKMAVVGFEIYNVTKSKNNNCVSTVNTQSGANHE